MNIMESECYITTITSLLGPQSNLVPANAFMWAFFQARTLP
ncbi:MAG TPA: hypothetical protein VMU68_03730 [Acidimicrobiales bacterium]|nr:hypothetical protein [Acidimicrobiales bacterium]